MSEHSTPPPVCEPPRYPPPQPRRDPGLPDDPEGPDDPQDWPDTVVPGIGGWRPQ